MPSGRFFTGIMQLITSVVVAAGHYRRRSRITNPVVAQSLSGVRTSQHAGRAHAHYDRRWRLLKSTGQTKRIKPSTHVRVDDAGVAMHTLALHRDRSLRGRGRRRLRIARSALRRAGACTPHRRGDGDRRERSDTRPPPPALRSGRFGRSASACAATGTRQIARSKPVTALISG